MAQKDTFPVGSGVGETQVDDFATKTNLNQKLPQLIRLGHVMGREITCKPKKSPKGNGFDRFAGTKTRFYRYLGRLDIISQLRTYFG